MEFVYNDDEQFFDDLIEESDGQLAEALSDDNGSSIDSDPHLYRPDVIDKVFKSLSADAQRADGELKRSDLNRTYLRKSLSIDECVSLEERLDSSGITIVDDEDLPLSDIQSKSVRYLTEGEERDLGRKIQLALQLPEDRSDLDANYIQRVLSDAKGAKDAFVVTNLLYVERVARRIGQQQHLSLDDLKQEGLLGLMHAADKFDPERGFRFKTYATFWIEQHIRRAITNNEREIRLPAHVHGQMLRIRRATAKFKLRLGRFPTLDELAKVLGLETESLMKTLWRIQLTECTAGDALSEDGSSLLSLLPDGSESTFDQIATQELHAWLRAALARLTPQESDILKMRFGIDVEETSTLERIGQQYGLTRERVRQIEAKALQKLLKPAKIEKISEFLKS